MELLDPNEWPFSAEKIALICRVTVRTAERWLAGESKPPYTAIRLLQLTQRERIVPDSWPSHWRINSVGALDIGHPRIALTTAEIEHYFWSITLWRQVRDEIIPAMEQKLESLMTRLPKAEVIDLAEYRERLKQMKSRNFYLPTNYTQK